MPKAEKMPTVGSVAEAKELLREAMSGLRPEMQELLIRHHVEGVSMKELARRSGKSVAAIESAMARARSALREAFLRRKGWRG